MHPGRESALARPRGSGPRAPDMGAERVERVRFHGIFAFRPTLAARRLRRTLPLAERRRIWAEVTVGLVNGAGSASSSLAAR